MNFHLIYPPLRISFLVISFLFYTQSYSQTQFCIAIGGSGSEIAYEILQTPDGGYVVAGWTTSFGQGGRDAYIVKLNSVGNTEWTRTVGGNSDDDLTSILQTDDGGFIVTGGTTTYGQGDKDVYIIKIAGAGTMMWTKTYGDFGYEVGGGIIDQNVGWIFCAWTTSFGSGAGEGYFLKTDNNGNLLWSQTIGGSGADLIYSLIPTNDGYFMAAGATNSFGVGSNDVYFTKFDTMGSLQWTKTIGGTGNDWGYSIIQTSDGGYCIGATTSSYGAGGDDFYVLKFDDQGSLEWTRTVGGSANEWSRSIIQTSDGGFAITGFTSSFGSGGQDVYLAKFNGNGILEWTRAFGGSGDDIGMSLIETIDGGLAITGSTTSFGSGGMDVYIIKISPDTANCCITSYNMGTTSSGGVIGSGGFTSSGGSVSSGGISGSGGILKNQCCLLQVSPNITQNNVACYGSNNGSAQANPSGGTPPYTFNWSNGQTGSAAIGLSTGVYFLTITDASSCLALDTVIITAPPPLNLFINKLDVQCGSGSGSACVTASGGQSPYTYLWSTGSANDTIPISVSGIYTVTVTDFNGCTNTNSVNVTVTAGFSLSLISQQDVSCYGMDDGSAAFSTTGGSPPFTFAWSNGQSGDSATGLSAGTYYLSVTDSAGCVKTDTLVITSPPPITAVTGTKSSICDNNTGSAWVSPSGGVPPFLLYWNTGSIKDTITGLNAGFYTVTVTDFSGCTSVNTIIVSDSGAAALLISSQQNVTCYGSDDGSATVIATGGYPPLTFFWSNGESGAGITQTAIDSLAGGDHSITVTDTAGCENFLAITITEPDSLIATATATDATCTVSGTANAMATGGVPPYSYIWNNGMGTQYIVSLQAGNYSVTVTDNNGCSHSAGVTINMVGSVDASITGGGPICAGNTIQLSASGGNNYLWNTGDTVPVINVTPDSTTFLSVMVTTGTCLDSAVYEVIVFPAVTVNAGNDTTIMIGGIASLTATISGDTQPFSIAWSPDGQTTTDFTVSPLSSVQYYVSVTDANGCMANDSVAVVVVLCDAEVFVPNAFAPGCRCADNYFRVYSDCIIQLNLYVFDRWGEKVFKLETDNFILIGQGDWWNGEYKNKPMDAGVYVWYIKYTTINNPEEEQTMEGNVHLIR